MKICLSWDELRQLVTELARFVIEDGRPDVIVGIQRGGLVPAVLVSHLLGVRSLVVLDVASTVSDEIHAVKFEPRVTQSPALSTLKGKDVLLVDDIVGTGYSLSAAESVVSQYLPLRLRSLACLVNRDNWDPRNAEAPSARILYLGREVRGWVQFPWEGSLH